MSKWIELKPPFGGDGRMMKENIMMILGSVTLMSLASLMIFGGRRGTDLVTVIDRYFLVSQKNIQKNAGKILIRGHAAIR